LYETTSEIYGWDESISASVRILDDDDRGNGVNGDHALVTVLGVVQIPMLEIANNVVFFRLASKPETYRCVGGPNTDAARQTAGACRYFRVTSIPTVELRFVYDVSDEKRDSKKEDHDVDDDCNNSTTLTFSTRTVLPSAVEMEWIDYPEEWPADEKEPFLTWLKQQCSTLCLSSYDENGSSFSACNFCEHEAVRYWGYFHRGADFDLVQLPPSLADDSSHTTGWINPLISRNDGIVTAPDDLSVSASPEEFARSILLSRWREFYTFVCPICLDDIQQEHQEQQKEEGGENPTTIIEVPCCGGMMCKDCFSSYVKMKVQEIQEYRYNPFVCPLLECRREIPIAEFVSKFLTTKQMDIIADWEWNLQFPRCNSLDHCLSPACGAAGDNMRWANEERRAQVFCNACQKTWCEWCLVRIDHDTIPYYQQHSCDDTKVNKILKFCQRYLKATKDKQKECMEKYPWIQSYATFFRVDASAKAWVLEHGQLCPTCENGVERSAGCFHMQCNECCTHFCYHCGQELRPPYYGTHHCWEEES